MRKLLILVVTLLLAVLPALAQDDIVIGGDDESLRRFLNRSHSVSTFSSDTQIYIESLPPNLPFDLPIPDEAEIVGSIETTGTYPYTFVMADVALSPDDVIAFYESSMGDDFTPVDLSPGRSGGGFQQATRQAHSVGFCYNTDEKVLQISAVPIPNSELTLAHIRVNEPQNMGNTCLQDDENTAFGDDLYQRLPVLTPPDDVMIGGGSGGGSSSDSAENRAELVAAEDTTVESLFTHFNEQLEAADWVFSDSITTEQIALSMWTFTDDNSDPFVGYLTVTASPTQDTRFSASIRIERIR